MAEIPVFSNFCVCLAIYNCSPYTSPLQNGLTLIKRAIMLMSAGWNSSRALNIFPWMRAGIDILSMCSLTDNTSRSGQDSKPMFLWTLFVSVTSLKPLRYLGLVIKLTRFGDEVVIKCKFFFRKPHRVSLKNIRPI